MFTIIPRIIFSTVTVCKNDSLYQNSLFIFTKHRNVYSEIEHEMVANMETSYEEVKVEQQEDDNDVEIIENETLDLEIVEGEDLNEDGIEIKDELSWQEEHSPDDEQSPKRGWKDERFRELKRGGL